MLYGSIVIGPCNIFIVLFVLISPENKGYILTQVLLKMSDKNLKVKFPLEWNVFVSNSLPM